MRSHPSLRWLAQVLILVMMTPYLVCPTPAAAQRSIPSVYVLDFNNKTKVGGALLGRVASAQMSLQLSESQNWDVVPDAQVQRRIQDLGFKPPFDRVNRVQIAQGIDATAVVYGHITAARVTGGSTPQAYVSIQVLVEDVNTGVLTNGAIADGVSTPRMGFTGDADLLLEEALGKAAFKAREFMDRFRLPEGTVLNTTVVGAGSDVQDLDALINVGARQGVRRGMEMIVTRQREVVGRIKVVSVDSDISTARVTTNSQGVRPEDRVRAIFNFSDFPITRTRLKAAAEAATEQVAKNPAKAAAEADKPVRIAKADKNDEFIPFRQQDKNLQLAQVTVDEPAPVVVEEPDVETGGESRGGKNKILNNSTLKVLVGGLLVLGILAIGGRGGENAARPDSVTAFAFQPAFGAPGAFIKVTWDRPKSVRSSQVLQYVVWRADTLGTPLSIVGALDTDSVKTFTDTEAARTVNAFDGAPGANDAGDRTAVNAPGIQAGVDYRYQIATAHENGLDRDMDGEIEEETYMSPLSMTSKFVTAITQPVIGIPASNDNVSDPSAFEVTWTQSPGANQYVIKVSSSPSFPDGKTVEFGPFNTVPGFDDVTQVININVNKLRNQGQRQFVAVGARNSGDPRPRPFGAVFSTPVSFNVTEFPPGPPSGGNRAGKNQDDDDKPKKGKGQNDGGNKRGGRGDRRN